MIGPDKAERLTGLHHTVKDHDLVFLLDHLNRRILEIAQVLQRHVGDFAVAFAAGTSSPVRGHGTERASVAAVPIGHQELPRDQSRTDRFRAASVQLGVLDAVHEDLDLGSQRAMVGTNHREGLTGLHDSREHDLVVLLLLHFDEGIGFGSEILQGEIRHLPVALGAAQSIGLEDG